MSIFDDLAGAGFPSDMEDDIDLMPILSIEEEDESAVRDVFEEDIPIIAVKNTVLFPGIMMPITVGRDKSIRAIQHAYEHERVVGVLTQRDADEEAPVAEDLYGIGTVTRIIKMLRMPDGTITAILQGRKRFRLRQMGQEEPFMRGSIEVLEPQPADDEAEFAAMIASIRDLAVEIVRLSPNIPSESSVLLKNIANDVFLLNFVVSNLSIDIAIKQHILEIGHLGERAEQVLTAMHSYLGMLRLRDKIESKVRVDMEKQQRDYFLNQQIRMIQEELGQNPHEEELELLANRAANKAWPNIARDAFERELKRVRRTNPQAAEYGMMVNYLEFLVDLPWQEYSGDNFNLKRVRQVLDRDHFGLDKVKERILEHLAVLKLKGDLKAPILCLVGPPGVGKTSLGRSVADALGRSYVRMALGGLHDEAEIRGHRKTYIGALPGRILQSLKKAATGNPVFILDEIDKLGNSFKGDPSSALLEVLDPEQNGTFYDNYLELEYDLSKVLFIATANSLDGIQPALLDRMEIIQVSGYSLEEKYEIAKRHLLPQSLREHGLEKKDLKLGKAALQYLIGRYTRESGVRALKRRIDALMRHTAKQVAMQESHKAQPDVADLRRILGPETYTPEAYESLKVPGVAIGLAWTSLGGEILFIECSLSPGKGQITLTGNLGNVMKESATTALSYLRAHSQLIGRDAEAMDQYNIHIHVPEGAIPKDGPSAGVTMLAALASAFSGRPLRPRLAMTGEITLRGRVLPVGGIKEKILAAKRAGIAQVLLCRDNEKDVAEVEADYLKGLDIRYVERMGELLTLALEQAPGA